MAVNTVIMILTIIFKVNMNLKSVIFQNGGQRAIFERNVSLRSAIVQYGGQRAVSLR